LGRPHLAEKFRNADLRRRDANSLEARFATKLAAVLKTNSSRLRLKIVPNVDSARALAAFDRRQADLALLRTDARVPPAPAPLPSWNMTCCC